MVTLAQVNFFILTDTFNMCHPSYESMSSRDLATMGQARNGLGSGWRVTHSFRLNVIPPPISHLL